MQESPVDFPVMSGVLGRYAVGSLEPGDGSWGESN